MPVFAVDSVLPVMGQTAERHDMNGNKVRCYTATGVVRNIDDDATEWRTYSDGLPRSSASGGVAGKGVVGIDRLAVDRATSKKIYAGIQKYGVYTSTDFGVNWHPTSLLTNTILLDMSANGPIVIAVSSRHNVFISTDSLASFTFLTTTQLPATPSAVKPCTTMT